MAAALRERIDKTHQSDQPCSGIFSYLAAPYQVDENLDGCVDWEEFRLMFNRNVNDKTGLEPSKLYNMVSRHDCRCRTSTRCV